MNRADLAWVDDYYRRISPHLFVREEDRLIIIPPNRVFKLNETGVRLLRHLSRRRSIRSFPGLTDGARAQDVHEFFQSIRDFSDGTAKDPGFSGAQSTVTSIPYTFDFTRLPVLGEIAVTYRCNNRCAFCYAGCGTGRPAEREMSTRALRRIIRIFRNDAKIPFFSFTGGEPLLRPDLEQVVAYARRLGLRTNLVTNGTLATSARAASLAAAGLDSAQVSVESPDAAVHDELVGIPGAHRRTIAGIASLKAAGISVQTNTTITRRNQHELVRMPAYLRTLGIERFAMNLYIPDSSHPRVDELFFPYSEIGPVVDAIGREAAKCGQRFFWYSPTPHCHFNPIARGLGNKSCAAMDGLISVSPTGDVLPCSSFPEPMGNLLRTPFRKIWFSERAAYFKFKRYAPTECNGCEKFVACQAACPLYWKFAGIGEIRRTASSADGSLVSQEAAR